MITDPLVVLRAKHPGSVLFRVFRGAATAPTLQAEDAVGHQRDVEHPEAFHEDHGLRITVTLSPALGRSAP